MPWAKRGVLLGPPHHLSWSASHAAVPTIDVGDGSVRLYFTSRDAAGRSHIAAATVDLDGQTPPEIQPEPVVSPGPPGAFDDSGAMSSCLVRSRDQLYLYYVGWSKAVIVPFYTFTGLAISDDGGSTFEKVRATPILDRSPFDPYMAHSPWVVVEGGRWRMWYSSCVDWRSESTGLRHYYHVKYAESDDGIEWRRDGRICVDFSYPGEHAIARPCVVRDGNLYRMWFAHRGDAYRIGYAESTDGLEWTRRDDRAGIDVSPSGWDSEMIEYPCVFDFGARRHMLYNGNGFGATGIGHAVWDDGPPVAS
jgi:hypothetical protein